MKIVFVITCLGVGGAEKVVVSLADALADLGHQVVIAYLKGDVLVKPCNPTVRLFGLNFETVKNLPRVFLSLRKLIKEFSPDVVHSHLVHANILSRLLRLSVYIPRLITTAHNRNEEGRLRMVAYRLTDGLADISTNVSEEAVAAFVEQKAVKPGRMIAVHNGISTSEFSYQPLMLNRIKHEQGINSSTKLLVAVGRLSEPKDYPNLLQALSYLSPSVSNYMVLIAGDGPLKCDLISRVSELGLDKNVRFLGLRRDVPELLRAADIFVLSSAWEGFPLVVGEAMACECMVVATDCGGVKEFLGDAGILVPAKNPHALAQKIENALVLTDEERAIYGKAARSRIENLYSLEASVEKWLNLYQGELVQSR